MIDLKWDLRFIELANIVATWSKDPSTQVGSVIVSPNRRIVSVGYNGFPHTTLNESVLYETITRNDKHEITIHAELNAIFNAAQNGASVKGATIYINYPPCHKCALAIIQSGIKEVVWDGRRQLKPSWYDSTVRATSLFNEAKIIYRNTHKDDSYQV